MRYRGPFPPAQTGSCRQRPTSRRAALARLPASAPRPSPGRFVSASARRRMRSTCRQVPRRDQGPGSCPAAPWRCRCSADAPRSENRVRQRYPDRRSAGHPATRPASPVPPTICSRASGGRRVAGLGRRKSAATAAPATSVITMAVIHASQSRRRHSADDVARGARFAGAPSASSSSRRAVEASASRCLASFARHRFSRRRSPAASHWAARTSRARS